MRKAMGNMAVLSVLALGAWITIPPATQAERAALGFGTDRVDLVAMRTMQLLVTLVGLAVAIAEPGADDPAAPPST